MKSKADSSRYQTRSKFFVQSGSYGKTGYGVKWSEIIGVQWHMSVLSDRLWLKQHLNPSFGGFFILAVKVK